MQSKKGILASALLGGLALVAMTSSASATYYSKYVVYARNGAELAAGIKKANENSYIKYIKCIYYRGCGLKGSLPTYTGSQRLKIDGNGSTIDASDTTDQDAFSATGGGSLKLVRLHFRGGLSGIYVEVPSDRSGDQRIDLWRVSVKGAALHGVHLNDGNGSPAGLKVGLYASHFADNGFEEGDQHGVQIEETGDGRVTVRALYTSFKDNSGDGMTVSEGGKGSVGMIVAKSRFEGNGDNPANPGDPEDGLDVDESGAGDVWLTVYRSRFSQNMDDGVDIDERDDGNIYSRLSQIRANENGDQGLTYDERGAGDHTVKVKDSQVENNDQGSQEIDIRAEQSESGAGTLTLENVAVGKVSTTGVELVVVP